MITESGAMVAEEMLCRLDRAGLSRYLDVFARNGIICVQDLELLDEDKMIQMGLHSGGERRAITARLMLRGRGDFNHPSTALAAALEAEKLSRSAAARQWSGDQGAMASQAPHVCLLYTSPSPRDS
eukprot:TRINITY_DN49532_c0_g1_i1.p2 TRINITY_DN49532_c0_g1~~TRINITY_DN49532_c0_g1_i1.p2  ORF type:complete len:126 (-),score=28.08 TRINITY_DN49532_c0_g1_i1:37-414(-)